MLAFLQLMNLQVMLELKKLPNVVMLKLLKYVNFSLMHFKELKL